MKNTIRNQTEKKKSSKKIKTVILILVILLLTAYLIASNFLVSACLVPEFMRKLDSFERITEESYAAWIHTSDITENRKMLQFFTEEWLRENEGEKLTVLTEDGYTLAAREFLQKEDSHLWVLVLHGYTGWKEEMYPFAAWYFREGFNALVPDQRCQGESEGDFIGMGYTDSYDCMLWIDHILEKDPDAKIVLHGQSMGAATALIMSGRELPENVKLVVSDSTYTDAYHMFGRELKEWFHLPAFPLVDTSCLMLRLRGGYDLKKASPLKAVEKSITPTLFIHGVQDDMIPVEMAYSLYEAAACEKDLLIIDGAGHGQTQDKAPADYFGAIKKMIDQYVTG